MRRNTTGKNHRHALAGIACILLLAGLNHGRAADASWRIEGAPYRALIQLREAPKNEEVGVLIDLPDFGQSLEDLGDVVLLDSKGTSLPLAKIRTGAGRRMLLLARKLEPREKYAVYFGGQTPHLSAAWTPRTSLLMETRRLPADARFDSWEQMQQAWQHAPALDGSGFVSMIYHGNNPFGPATNYMTHYTGWLDPGNQSEVTLYTLSSDASFVLVNEKLELDWPGIHSPWTLPKNAHTKTVTCPPGGVRIDYYQAKGNLERPAGGTVLGWKRDGKMETIPPAAWLHPGTTSNLKIEDARGWPIPLPKIEPLTFIGYADRWYFETVCTPAYPLPAGWTAEWKFDDGTLSTGTDCRHVFTGTTAQIATLTLRRGSDTTAGVKYFFFGDDVRPASIKNPADVARYVGLLAGEAPAQLTKQAAEDGLALMCDFGIDSQIAPFAEAWLRFNPASTEPLWLYAQLARLRFLAQTDPKGALAELKKIDPAGRKKFSQYFDLLEIDLMVFSLHDPAVEESAKRVAFENPNTETERIAKIRVGDFYRLTDRFKEAVAQYQSVQKNVVDETAGRKLPAQDQAYSIAIEDLLESNLRREASEKMREWELKHPMAKFEGEFLLLRGRVLNAFGRWTDAIAELDSFKKIQHDNPYVIDADFYRAVALRGLGRTAEAREIWNGIAKNFPKHELTAKSRVLAAQP